MLALGDLDRQASWRKLHVVDRREKPPTISWLGSQVEPPAV